MNQYVLTEEGKKCFFPNNESQQGKLSEMEIGLANFAGNEITDFALLWKEKRAVKMTVEKIKSNSTLSSCNNSIETTNSVATYTATCSNVSAVQMVQGAADENIESSGWNYWQMDQPGYSYMQDLRDTNMQWGSNYQPLLSNQELVLRNRDLEAENYNLRQEVKELRAQLQLNTGHSKFPGNNSNIPLILGN